MILERAERYARFVRDVGIIVGVPILLVVAGNLYKSYVDVLKEQNSVLTQTQYDKALAMIKSQRELFELERKTLHEEMKKLKADVAGLSDANNKLVHEILLKLAELQEQQTSITSRLEDQFRSIRQRIGGVEPVSEHISALQAHLRAIAEQIIEATSQIGSRVHKEHTKE